MFITFVLKTLFVQNVCEILLDLGKSVMCTFRSNP